MSQLIIMRHIHKTPGSSSTSNTGKAINGDKGVLSFCNVAKKFSEEKK